MLLRILGTPQGERYFYHLGKPTGDGVLIDAVDSDIIHLRGNMIEAFVNSPFNRKIPGDKEFTNSPGTCDADPLLDNNRVACEEMDTFILQDVLHCLVAHYQEEGDNVLQLRVRAITMHLLQILLKEELSTFFALNFRTNLKINGFAEEKSRELLTIELPFHPRMSVLIVDVLLDQLS